MTYGTGLSSCPLLVLTGTGGGSISPFFSFSSPELRWEFAERGRGEVGLEEDPMMSCVGVWSPIIEDLNQAAV